MVYTDGTMVDPVAWYETHADDVALRYAAIDADAING